MIRSNFQTALRFSVVRYYTAKILEDSRITPPQTSTSVARGRIFAQSSIGSVLTSLSNRTWLVFLSVHEIQLKRIPIIG